MPNLRKPQLLERIVTSIKEAGLYILFISDSHPFELQIYKGDESYRVKIYIWNITHGGGRARPTNEYRIQITGVQDHFVPVAKGKTLILGWWDEIGVFAGFDYQLHSGSLGASPSMQIKKECLEQAAETGFSPCDKGNQEVAIAFRPDFLVEYIRNLEHLHRFGENPEEFAILEEVSQNPDLAVNDEDINIQDANRKIVVSTVSRKLRDNKFRGRVLAAYKNSCAFCGVQLRLVEAAHIVPVEHPNSTDETRNGLTLCSLHHTAFDQALVTLSGDYRVVLNLYLIDELSAWNLAGGLDSFTHGLQPRIIAPDVQNDRPHQEYIRIANEVRGWRQEQLEQAMLF